MLYAAGLTKKKNGLAWIDITTHNKEKVVYNLGLAHGNISILYFLLKCYEKNIMKSACLDMIRQGVHFYFNSLNQEPGALSFFPNIVYMDTSPISSHDSRSRLAWCYGDLGILHTLYLIGDSLSDPVLVDRSLAMLEASTLRKDLTANHVIDSCLCHGSAGIAYIYMHLYQRTSQPIFADAAQYWTEKTLEFNRSLNEGLEYVFYTQQETSLWVPDILNGLGGVLLFYLSVRYPDSAKNWNPVFFLS